jgi:hypothetical protein
VCGLPGDSFRITKGSIYVGGKLIVGLVMFVYRYRLTLKNNFKRLWFIEKQKFDDYKTRRFDEMS